MSNIVKEIVEDLENKNDAKSILITQAKLLLIEAMVKLDPLWEADLIHRIDDLVEELSQ